MEAKRAGRDNYDVLCETLEGLVAAKAGATEVVRDKHVISPKNNFIFSLKSNPTTHTAATAAVATEVGVGSSSVEGVVSSRGSGSGQGNPTPLAADLVPIEMEARHLDSFRDLLKRNECMMTLGREVGREVYHPIRVRVRKSAERCIIAHNPNWRGIIARAALVPGPIRVGHSFPNPNSECEGLAKARCLLCRRGVPGRTGELGDVLCTVPRIPTLTTPHCRCASACVVHRKR